MNLEQLLNREPVKIDESGISDFIRKILKDIAPEAKL